VNAVLAGQGRVFCLRSDQIAERWQDFAHHLERVCEEYPDELNLGLIKADLLTARKQFWGYHDGSRITVVAITEIQHPVCFLRACVGHETWPGQIDAGVEAIEAWARDIGCKRIKFGGRTGWKRRLPSFNQIGVILEKHL
jgi:hypothetical protein